LIVTSLMPFLNGCASDPVIQTRTEIQRVPEALTVACPVSVLEGSSYQAAIALALALKGDLAECNKRLDDIRRWSQQ
jgi:hypothetical protein